MPLFTPSICRYMTICLLLYISRSLTHMHKWPNYMRICLFSEAEKQTNDVKKNEFLYIYTKILE
jgi:hypothetical protein